MLAPGYITTLNQSIVQQLRTNKPPCIEIYFLKQRKNPKIGKKHLKDILHPRLEDLCLRCVLFENQVHRQFVDMLLGHGNLKELRLANKLYVDKKLPNVLYRSVLSTHLQKLELISLSLTQSLLVLLSGALKVNDQLRVLALEELSLATPAGRAPITWPYLNFNLHRFRLRQGLEVPELFSLLYDLKHKRKIAAVVSLDIYSAKSDMAYSRGFQSLLGELQKHPIQLQATKDTLKSRMKNLAYQPDMKRYILGVMESSLTY